MADATATPQPTTGTPSASTSPPPSTSGSAAPVSRPFPAGTGTASIDPNTAYQNIQQLNDYVARNRGSLSQEGLDLFHNQKSAWASALGYKVNPDGSVVDQNGNPVASLNAGTTLNTPFGSIPSSTGTTGTTSSSGANASATTQGGGGQSFANVLLNAAQNPKTGVPEVTVQGPNGQSVNEVVWNGRALATANDLATLGVQWTKDPNTGIYTINGHQITPVQYDKSGNPIFATRQALNAAGYTDNQIQYDSKNNTVTVQRPQQQQQQSPQPDLLDQLLSQMPQQPGITPYTPPDLSSYYQNLMPVSQQFNPDWNSYYQQAGDQLNPVAQQNIDTLMNKQGQDLTKADEGLNAKGIFNSGIAVQMENQIRANTNDQVAKVLTTLQSNIAKQAQTLYKDAYTQWYQGNTLALKNNQMWLTQAMDQRKQAFTQWLDTQKLSQTQYNYAVNAWDKMSTLALNDAHFQATQQLNYQKMMLPYTMGPTPQQQITDQLNTSKVTGFYNGAPTLDTFKALGYVQMPDGKLVPTQQATYQNQQTAIKWAQTMGYTIGPDGKTLIPTEQATNNNQNYYVKLSQQLGYVIGPNGQPMHDSNGNKIPTLDKQKLQAQIDQWKQTDTLDAAKLTGYLNGNPTMARTLMDNTIQHDKAMVDVATANATNAQDKTQIDAIGRQLSALDGQINAEIARGVDPSTVKDPTTGQSLIDQRNGLMDSLGQAAQNMATVGDTSTTADSSATSTDPFGTSYNGSQSPLAPDQLNSVMSQAAQLAGVPSSWVGPLVQIAMHESSGIPGAVNPQGIDTSGNPGSEHATGLMQTIPSTFQEYALPGHTDINNPLDNAIAAIRYINSRYGDANVALQHSLNGGY